MHHRVASLLRILPLVLLCSAAVSLHAATISIDFLDPLLTGGTVVSSISGSAAGIAGASIPVSLVSTDSFPAGNSCSGLCTFNFTTGPVTLDPSGPGAFDFAAGGSFTLNDVIGGIPTVLLNGDFLSGGILIYDPTGASGWSMQTLGPLSLEITAVDPGFLTLGLGGFTPFSGGATVAGSMSINGTSPLFVTDPSCTGTGTCFQNPQGPINGNLSVADGLPEPSSFVLLGSGLIGLSLWCSRRKRS